MSFSTIYANPELLLIESCAGLRRFGANPQEKSYLLKPDASAAEVGLALLDTLARYRELSADEVGIFFDLANVEKRYEIWVDSLIEQFGYKSRKALFKSMKHCTVRTVATTITIQPTKHEKIEAWGGKGINEEDHVLIDINSPPEKIGEAVFTALKRCK